ncbi:MAG: phage/plasmid primase, P4 family, partial [Deltaproteobacteria bacterium]|nr:phage/plasmid primase, P4 family [Deltaproteobacteria bacterium]
NRLGSYTEISPSGRGVHVIARGKLPDGSRRTGKVEMYDDHRFFTITGNMLQGTPAGVVDRRKEVLEVYQSIFPQPQPRAVKPSGQAQLDDDVLIEMAKNADNGKKFRRLWSGDFSAYPSQSEADLALCRILAFWTKRHAASVDRLFRQSGLIRPKWDVPHFGAGKTYGQATIEKAIEADGEVYSAGSQVVNAELRQREFNLTDLGNAERLVHHFGEHICYCYAWKKWLVWDGVRWTVDQSGQIHQIAKQVVRKIYREVQSVDDPDKRRAISRHAMASESDKRIAAMISLAQSEVSIRPELLNADPWLLNCLNGTVNLRTGRLLPHTMEHFITKLAPVNFDPNSACPRWLEFLSRILNGNEQLIDFLQRAVGYALTGETSEQCLFIFYGSGANGKSTFLQTMSYVLGDYSMSTPTETLLVKRSGAIPNDVARLKGARFVIACEADAENRLAESLIKQMTGGDSISARFLHQEWFDFEPTHKVFFGTNHKPVIRGTDYAIWRRIRLVPFEITIPEGERDKNLPEKLKAEADGILAWEVQGCQFWQQQGLGVPEEVKAATDSYREEMDILGEYLKDRCRQMPEARVSSKDLYESYSTWCQDNGQEPLGQRAFVSALKEKGFKQCRIGHGAVRGWIGIGLMEMLTADRC